MFVERSLRRLASVLNVASGLCDGDLVCDALVEQSLLKRLGRLFLNPESSSVSGIIQFPKSKDVSVSTER
jgi:hypothetical protein